MIRCRYISSSQPQNTHKMDPVGFVCGTFRDKKKKKSSIAAINPVLSCTWSKYLDSRIMFKEDPWALFSSYRRWVNSSTVFTNLFFLICFQFKPQKHIVVVVQEPCVFPGTAIHMHLYEAGGIWPRRHQTKSSISTFYAKSNSIPRYCFHLSPISSLL